MKRRQFFKTLAGFTAIGVAAPAILTTLTPNTALAEESRRKKAAGGDSEMVSPDDPTAKAVEYVEVAKKNKKSAGNKCETCQLYVKAADKNGKKVGTCALFPKKYVLGAGYCNSWAKKQG